MSLKVLTVDDYIFGKKYYMEQCIILVQNIFMKTH